MKKSKKLTVNKHIEIMFVGWRYKSGLNDFGNRLDNLCWEKLPSKKQNLDSLNSFFWENQAKPQKALGTENILKKLSSKISSWRDWRDVIPSSIATCLIHNGSF